MLSHSLFSLTSKQNSSLFSFFCKSTEGQLKLLKEGKKKAIFILTVLEVSIIPRCAEGSDSLYSENELHTFSSLSLVQCSSLSALMVIYWFDFELRTEL